MKSLIALTIFLISTPAWASWSAFAHVTPSSEGSYGLRVEVIESTLNPRTYQIKIPAIEYEWKHAWLLVTESHLAPNKQEFRNSIWWPENSVNFIVRTQLRAEPDEYYKRIEKKFYFLELSAEIMKSAYVYIDFPLQTFDGGYYYSIDLSRYIDRAEKRVIK